MLQLRLLGAAVARLVLAAAFFFFAWLAEES
jgi:hypothetical protein